MLNGMHNNYYANMFGECVCTHKLDHASLCIDRLGGLLDNNCPRPNFIRKKSKFIYTVHAPGEKFKLTNPC